MYSMHFFFKYFFFRFCHLFYYFFHGKFTSTQHIGDAGEQGAPAVQGEAAGGLPAGQGPR